jgi:hypothetical protein
LVEVPKGVAELGRDEAVASMAEEDNKSVELVGVPMWSGYCCSSCASGCCSCRHARMADVANLERGLALYGVELANNVESSLVLRSRVQAEFSANTNKLRGTDRSKVCMLVGAVVQGEYKYIKICVYY